MDSEDGVSGLIKYYGVVAGERQVGGRGYCRKA
jgi:hypothetical protein